MKNFLVESREVMLMEDGGVCGFPRGLPDSYTIGEGINGELFDGMIMLEEFVDFPAAESCGARGVFFFVLLCHFALCLI